MAFWIITIAIACSTLLIFLIPDRYTDAPVRKLVHSNSAVLLGKAAAVIAFTVVLFTAYQIWTDLEDRKIERDTRKAEAIDRAWARLLNTEGGNTGKGGALSFLVSNNIDVTGLDLSCKAGGFNMDSKLCPAAPIFSNVVIDGAATSESGRHTISQINLAGSIFQLPVLKSVHISGIVQPAEFYEPTIISSEIVAYGSGLIAINGGVFVDSLLEGETVHVASANVSGSIIRHATDEAFWGNFAWADAPPRVGSDEGPYWDILKVDVTLCEPPVGPSGKIVPLKERVLNLQDEKVCKAVTVNDAKSRFGQNAQAKP